ncbi:MAG: hypothetical protein HYU68_03420 [Bacteroidetes bacterium]|nr:hypothetical protein [Bacteroidota bacterium]
MTETPKSLPKWILIVSGLFALMELMVSVTLCFSPQSVLETVDLNAKGVDYVVYMWAARQFALGFIFGFATINYTQRVIMNKTVSKFLQSLLKKAKISSRLSFTI